MYFQLPPISGFSLSPSAVISKSSIQFGSAGKFFNMDCMWILSLKSIIIRNSSVQSITLTIVFKRRLPPSQRLILILEPCLTKRSPFQKRHFSHHIKMTINHETSKNLNHKDNYSQPTKASSCNEKIPTVYQVSNILLAITTI